MRARDRGLGWCRKFRWLAWTTVMIGVPLVAQKGPEPAQVATGYQIAGTLLNTATGDPVQRATVSVSDMDNQTLASVTTDAQGRFTFEGLPAAKYPLTASKRGYRTAFYDDHEGYNTAIVTGPDQDTTHLIFFLVPGSVLRGVVTADGGDPVEGAQVILYEKPRFEPEDEGVRQMETTTDDTGAYEFANLSDGSYLIAVVAHPWYAMHRAPANADSKNAKELDVAYPVTYYDSTTDEESATPISIGLGVHEQADLHLHAMPAVRITVDGVRRADGRLARPELQQVVFGRPIFAESVGFVDALKKGSADFNGMAPGHYELTVGDPPRIVDLDATENRQVEPDAGSPTVSITGTLRTPNGAPILENGHLTLSPQRGVMKHANINAPIRNGRFQVDAVAAGTWTVTLETDGTVTPVLGIGTGTTVQAGNTIAVRDHALDVLVLVGAGSGRIDGVVQKDAKGFGGAMVVLVPKDQNQLKTLARRDQSDSDGSFSLHDVVPGPYTVVAVEDGWKLDWTAPGALASYLPRGTAVTVQDNPEATVHPAGPVVVQPR